MKLGVISQRMDLVQNYEETRDAIDVMWYKLFEKMNAILVPMPNFLFCAEIILKRLNLDFIVLSGGNTPVAYGGTASERDAVDEMLITYAIRHKIPLLGVCRGTQSIALYFGGTLKKIENHVATMHVVFGSVNRNVNSYHRYAIDILGNDLQIIAESQIDGNIEAIRHSKYEIYGIMWHPERVYPFCDEDIRMIKEWLRL